jgi:hypothetical protein
MIDIYDDVLEEHNAILVDDMVRQISWKYDYHSNITKVNKHWHVLCGNNEEECISAGFDWAIQIFSIILKKYKFKEKYDIEGFKRIYCNSHTHGIEPHIHTDDGDFTMIYYPRLDWELEWGGGTAVYKEDTGNPKDPNYKANFQLDKSVTYKGNRLIIFDAYLPHQALPVSRECYQLRTCVVFKCNVSGGNRDRLDFYKDNLSKGNFKVEVIN